MRDASVGFQCPECVAEGARSVRAPRTVFGGTVSASEGLVSKVLIGINVAAFLIMISTGDFTSKIYEYGVMLASGDNMVLANGDTVSGVADGAYWRLLTAAFLHEGLLHIAFNMYALYLFGPLVERALGVKRYLAAYLTIAIGSSVFVYFLSGPNTFTLGASGAIFGLFAMALVFFIKAKQDVTYLLVMLAINAVISLQGNISWQGHLGGFLIGLVVGAGFAYAPRDRRNQVQVLMFAALWVAIIGGVIIRTAQLTI